MSMQDYPAIASFNRRYKLVKKTFLQRNKIDALAHRFANEDDGANAITYLLETLVESAGTQIIDEIYAALIEEKANV